jgi:hypothetical protein
MSVKESAAYENYLDQTSRLNDDYRMTLEQALGEVIETPLADNSGRKIIDPEVWKVIYVHFRNVEDIVDFSKRIGAIVGSNIKDMFYPLVDQSASLFPEEQKSLSHVDPNLVKSTKLAEETTLDIHIEDGEDVEWQKHWVGMPEYEYIEDNGPYRSINMKFRNENDYQEFAKRIDQPLTDKTKAIWHPKLERTPNYLLRWIEE